MFLHTNLSPKWSLGVPAEFAFYNRRWQVRVQQMNCSKLSYLSATLFIMHLVVHALVYDTVCVVRVPEFVAHNALRVQSPAAKLLKIGWVSAYIGLGAWKCNLSDCFAKFTS